MVTTTSRGHKLFEQGQVNPDVLLNDILTKLPLQLFSTVKDKDLVTPPGSEADWDAYLIAGTEHAIDSFTESTGIVLLESGPGDVTATYTAGKKFLVKESTSNNGQKTVISSSFGGGKTSIEVSESLTDEASPSPGKSYIAGGAWNGYVDNLTIFYNDQYYFMSPLEGYGPVFVQDEDVIYYYDGTDWILKLVYVNANGVLNVPTLTTAAKGAISPSNGDIVYDSDLAKHQGYNGSWNNFY